MRRTRVPGPLVHTQSVGNTADRVADGVSRWISVDVNDGKWTKVASADMSNEGTNVETITTTASGMRIVQDIDDDNKNWNQNAHTADRWYTKLKADGRELVWSDIFAIEFLVERTAQGAQDRAGIVIGLCHTATLTATANAYWIGLQAYNRNNTAGMIMRVGSGGGNSEVEDADGVKCYANFVPAFDDDDAGDANPMMRRGMGIMLNSSNETVKAGGMPDNAEEFTATDPVYLFFSPHFRNTTSQQADPDDTWKVWYRLSYSDDNVSPEYVPGGGVSR